MKRTIRTLVLLAAAAPLASCQISGPGPGVNGPITSQPVGPSGNWIGTDGVAISTFGGGTMVSTASDTGAKLAEGTYMVNGNLVELTMTSVARGTTTRINCLMVSQNQMNCTASTGGQFSLVRTNRQPGIAAVTPVQPGLTTRAGTIPVQG